MKGINLNYENSKFVNHIALSRMILEDNTPLHVHSPKNIKRKYGGGVLSEPERKGFYEAPAYEQL